MKKGGTRQTLYCPFFPDQDVDELWTYKPDPNGYSVIGYFYLGRRLDPANPSQAAPNFPTMLGRGYLETSLGPVDGERGLELPSCFVVVTRLLREETEIVEVGRWTGDSATVTALAPALAALYPTKPSDVELMTDPVFQENGQWSAYGGWNHVHVTPHIRHGQPIGGNILYLDWHVDFRQFKEMKRREF